MTQMEFNIRVSTLHQPLKNFALKLTRDTENAADLTQETITKAFYNRDKFREGTNMKAWLYTIMKNIFINNYRRTSKVKTILDFSPNTYYINLAQNVRGGDPDSKLSLKEITKTINNLDNEYKIPFNMYFEGYKYHEISDHLKIPIGTVKTRIHVARKSMKKTLSSYKFEAQ